MYSDFGKKPLMFRIVPILIVIGIIFIAVTTVMNQSNVATVPDCKVQKLISQQIIDNNRGDMNTHYRYLVVTNKETFVCESSMLNLKFNNSDIFWRLKEDSTYTFKVVGFGKSPITEYRNIISIVK